MSYFQYSIVVPVFNEKINIKSFCKKAKNELGGQFEILICFDMPEDNTKEGVEELLADERPENIRFIHNTLGQGPRFAIESGMKAANSPVVVVMMADISDDFSIVEKLVAEVENGSAVACGSRYMRGGRQLGGPWLKKLMSKSAGISLHWLVGLPTHDATNSFKAYSKTFLDKFPIQSKGGFSLGMELTLKAFRAKEKISEIPSVWIDRTDGESRFRLWKWLPEYLSWYDFGLKSSMRPLLVAAFLLSIYGVLFFFGNQIRNSDLNTYQQGYLDFENGNPAYRTELISKGKMIYRDFACQYGPIPVYARYLLSLGFGNNAFLDCFWHNGFSILEGVLVFLIVWKYIPSWWAFFLTAFCVFPLISQIKYGCTEYQGFEHCLAMILLLILKPVNARSWRTNIAIGSLAGLIQLTKFGPAIFLLVSVIIVDILFLIKKKKFDFIIVISSGLVLVSSFLAIQALFLIWSFISMPIDLAIDAGFPRYVRDSYIGQTRPHWVDYKHFFAIQFPILISIICALMGLFYLILSFKKNLEISTLVVGIIFYVISMPFLLGHVFLYYKYAVFFLPFALVFSYSQSWVIFGLLLLSNLCPFLIQNKIAFWNTPNINSKYIYLADGNRVQVSPSYYQDYEFFAYNIFPFVSEQDNIFLINGWGGGGFHREFNQWYPIRNYLCSPTAFRDYDRKELVSKHKVFKWCVLRIDDPQDESRTQNGISKKYQDEIEKVVGADVFRLWFGDLISLDLVKLNNYLVIKIR